MIPVRNFVIAANWKMNKSPREAEEFFTHFLPDFKPQAGHEVIFFVPALDLHVVRKKLEPLLTTKGIKWGAQNCYHEKDGAFTGENSPQVLAELKTPCALVGHSERRTIFGETDEMLAKKVQILQSLGIAPMLCVGESLSEREGGKTNEVILRQLRKGLALATAPVPPRGSGASAAASAGASAVASAGASACGHATPIYIAYEPVWAIGTGKVATSEQANQAHQCLREGLTQLWGQAAADITPILYGGSVKPENATELRAQPEIDGFLVGGASLKPESFLALC